MAFTRERAGPSFHRRTGWPCLSQQNRLALAFTGEPAERGYHRRIGRRCVPFTGEQVHSGFICRVTGRICMAFTREQVGPDFTVGKTGHDFHRRTGRAGPWLSQGNRLNLASAVELTGPTYRTYIPFTVEQVGSGFHRRTGRLWNLHEE
jgi:hypothetical protein